MSTLPAGEQPPTGEQGSQQGTVAPQPGIEPAKAPADAGLARDTPVMMTDKDGKTISPTVGEMADAFRSQPSAEDLKELGLYRKAIKENDPAAASELFGMYAPKPNVPASEPTPSDKRVAELEATVNELKAVVTGELSPIVGQISTEAKLHQNRLMIAQRKDKFPFLAKTSRGPSLIENRKKAYEELAKANGYDLNKAPAKVLADVAERVMQDVETELRGLYGEISGTTPPVPGQGIVSVNDQGSSKKEATSAPPRYRQNRDGVFVDESLSPGATGVPEPLPSAPVTPVPAGSPVGVQGDMKPEGPMDVGGLTERMRQRNEQLGGVL